MKLWFYLLVLQLLLDMQITFAIPVESATGNKVETTEQALDYLTKYGYNTCKNTSEVVCSVDASSLLKQFQKTYGLKETGTLDDATKVLMRRPRCGNSDIQQISQSNLSSKWSSSSLTWSLRGNPNELSFADTALIMQWAFEHWTDHIPIQIKQTCSTCQANIVIDFLSRNHQDLDSFDGPGGTLAHAFFPEDGRIHFDKDEKWNNGFTDGNSLYLMAVHEIGHALGFDHQTSVESIMYPYSKAMLSNKILPSIDRAAAQKVYGHQYPSTLKEGQRLNRTERLRSPDGNHSLVMQSDGNLVIYKHYPSLSKKLIWESGTSGGGTAPYYAILNRDGNFVIYDKSQKKIWETETKEKKLHTFLKMQDDGNLVLYKNMSAPILLWTTEGKQRPATTTLSATTMKTTTVPETTSDLEYIRNNFQKAFPNHTIALYKYEKGSARYFYGTQLLKVILKDGCYLEAYKLSQSSGKNLTTEQIDLIAEPFIDKTKGEKNNLKRRDILYRQLKGAFPRHYVNIFIFNDSEWERDSYNEKGSTYYEKNYGSEVDIILT